MKGIRRLGAMVGSQLRSEVEDLCVQRKALEVPRPEKVIKLMEQVFVSQLQGLYPALKPYQIGDTEGDRLSRLRAQNVLDGSGKAWRPLKEIDEDATVEVGSRHSSILGLALLGEIPIDLFFGADAARTAGERGQEVAERRRSLPVDLGYKNDDFRRPLPYIVRELKLHRMVFGDVRLKLDGTHTLQAYTKSTPQPGLSVGLFSPGPGSGGKSPPRASASRR
jgi:hypothetical protein